MIYLEKKKRSTGIYEFLPTICDETIYEDGYHKITKIAQFNKECYVNTYDDKWYVRPEWDVEYVLTEI